MAVVFVALRSHCLATPRNILLKSVLRPPVVNVSKGIGNNSQSAFHKANVTGRSPTLKERLLAPQQGTVINIGRGVLLGASALGIGSLCYYGMGLASEPSAIEKSMVWPEFVRDRIKSTYSYIGGSVLITAVSAMAFSKCRIMMYLMSRDPLLTFCVLLIASIGSLKAATLLPYSEEFGRKQVAWMIFTGLQGIAISPICMLGGPLILRAACYTVGIVGGLSAVAVCAPSEKFLYIGGSLACVLGVMCATSLVSIFLPPVTALGAGLYSFSMYGGLTLFGCFMLYDTQRIIHNAESHPPNAIWPYDPVNESLSIYLDILNIFIRIVTLLAESDLAKKAGKVRGGRRG